MLPADKVRDHVRSSSRRTALHDFSHAGRPIGTALFRKPYEPDQSSNE